MLLFPLEQYKETIKGVYKMGNQVLPNDKKIRFPDGSAYEVSNDGGISYHGIGVLEGGCVFTYNYDRSGVETGNAGDTKNKIKNETLTMAPSTVLSWDPEIWAKFMGGALTYVDIPGVLVEDAIQTVAALAASYQKLIKIENQNSDLGAITVNSVTGGTDGALTVTTDYTIGQNEKGEYGIMLVSGGNITTLDQIITIDYDYTPASGKKVTAGTSSLVLEDFMVRVVHYTDDALTTFDMELIAKSVDSDSGLSFNEKGANEDGVNGITVAMTAKNKAGSASGEQLFEYYIATSAYDE
jgi:hypothetical protein